MQAFKNVIGSLSTFLQRKRAIVFFTLLSCFLLSTKAFSTNYKLNVAMNSPEWNSKFFCDEGRGVQLEPLTAPSISISLAPNATIEDNYYYDYKWERKDNDGAWMTVKEGNKTTLVPALDPGMVVNNDSLGRPLKVSYRLSLRSIEGGEWYTGEEYQTTIAAPLMATFKTSNANNNSSVDLLVHGGLSNKTYLWTSLSEGVSVPESQKTQEDPKGFKPGQYQVLIKDDCQEKRFIIDIQPSYKQ